MNRSPHPHPEFPSGRRSSSGKISHIGHVPVGYFPCSHAGWRFDRIVRNTTLHRKQCGDDRDCVSFCFRCLHIPGLCGHLVAHETWPTRFPAKKQLARLDLNLLSNVGLVPLSQALTGWLIKLSIDGLFIGAGSLMILLAVWLAVAPERRSLALKMDPQPTA